MKKYIDAEAFMDALYSIDPENDGSDGCTIIAQNMSVPKNQFERNTEQNKTVFDLRMSGRKRRKK